MSENIATDYLELQPAYGRDYKTKAEVEKAFRDNRDFIGDYSIGFKYINMAQFAKGTKVLLRYKALSMVCEVTV